MLLPTNWTFYASCKSEPLEPNEWARSSWHECWFERTILTKKLHFILCVIVDTALSNWRISAEGSVREEFPFWLMSRPTPLRTLFGRITRSLPRWQPWMEKSWIMAWNVAVVGPEKSGKSSVVARLTSGSLENEVKFVRKQRASLLHGQTCIKFGRRCALDETVWLRRWWCCVGRRYYGFQKTFQRCECGPCSCRRYEDGQYILGQCSRNSWC
jgi:hypothetical protein